MLVENNLFSVKGFTRSLSVNIMNQKASFIHKEFKNQKLEKFKLLNSNSSTERESKEWSSPNYISNAVITISVKNKLDKLNNLEFVIQFLRECHCRNIVFIFNDLISITFILSILQLIIKNRFHNFTVILNYDEKYYSDEFGDIIMNNELGKKLMVFDSPFDKNYENTMYFFQKPFRINYEKNLNNFTINHDFFLEAQNHNSYYNKKFCIDKDGNIKNGIEDNRSFGNIKSIKKSEKLFEILNNKIFQKYWNVSKDKCEVCRDCEFRYICNDNRVPILKNNDSWYFKEECNYNPYIGKWNNEQGYKTIKEFNSNF